MMGKMLVGKLRQEFERPDQYCQFAGQSADIGFVHLLIIALVSISLGI
jgi:hypothetical protein